MYQAILYEVTDPIATITLNRPENLNAWTGRMAEEVGQALGQAEADERVVGIIITGAGRGFCAGADLGDLQAIISGKGEGISFPSEAPEAGDTTMERSFRGVYSYLASICKPIIAAINGPCAGMALSIVLYSDLRFCSDKAVFTTAFARRGLIAEWGSSWTLSRLVGYAHALDLLLSGRRIDPHEAERMGLVNRVVPHDELMSFTRQYVCDLAENCSPASMAIMKKQVYQDLVKPLSDANDEANRLMTESVSRVDFQEGVLSFLGNRPPTFARIGKKD